MAPRGTHRLSKGAAPAPAQPTVQACGCKAGSRLSGSLLGSWESTCLRDHPPLFFLNVSNLITFVF